MASSFFELLRADPLTDCKNYLGFLETLTNPTAPGQPGALSYSMKQIAEAEINAGDFSAILIVDMNDLSLINQEKGYSYGDSSLRWMGILLREESGAEVYRVGGDEFTLLLKLETREQHLALVKCVIERMEREARQLGFPHTAADLALILFDQVPNSLDSLLMKMGAALAQVKADPGTQFKVFDAAELEIPIPSPEMPNPGSDSRSAFSYRWLLLHNLHQVLNMGRKLDDIQQEAYTDLISGLPNMKAALRQLERAHEYARIHNKPYSLMMIDGDNIRIYNRINYAAGDVMIRDMSMILKSSLRPSDFVARWRTGDEFMVVLPDTSPEFARMIGERFRLAVKEASRGWKYPVTISVGVASYPEHGANLNALIDKAEAANKQAKDLGKDRVVLAG